MSSGGIKNKSGALNKCAKLYRPNAYPRNVKDSRLLVFAPIIMVQMSPVLRSIVVDQLLKASQFVLAAGRSTTSLLICALNDSVQSFNRNMKTEAV